MSATIPEIVTTKAERAFENSLAEMSPFEVKNLLLSMARECDHDSTCALLNAGRGNPNWICTLPRQAFYLLGQFGIEEARRAMSQPDFHLAGMPQKPGIAGRFVEFLERHEGEEACVFLRQCYDWCLDQGYDADGLVHEWAQGMNGCEYPMPERILRYTQQITRKYLTQEMTAGKVPDQPWDLFATEGSTAAMCYLFYSLKCNFLIQPGDTIALMTPIFTPYLNIPGLNDYALNVVDVKATTIDAEGLHTWQYPDEELEKLADPKVKLLCLVNPTNPPSVAMDAASQRKLVEIVREKNPNLMIVSDDVYGTFVKDYHSIIEYLPRNTMCLYSYSKYFGATGWRVAAIALSPDNVYDAMIAALPEDKKKVLASRYSCLTDHVAAEKFIDRMVADSRLVALNGTAGLSTPQQVLMSLFSLHGILDHEQREDMYKTRMQDLVMNRFNALWKSLGWTVEPDPLRAGYYSIVDLGLWAARLYGDDFATWLKANYDSLDIVIRLAKDTGIVLMNGPGFDAPDWSVRVSLANLRESDYIAIGKGVSDMLAEYAETWKAETGK